MFFGWRLRPPLFGFSFYFGKAFTTGLDARDQPQQPTTPEFMRDVHYVRRETCPRLTRFISRKTGKIITGL
jgi:hypothetical protein